MTEYWEELNDIGSKVRSIIEDSESAENLAVAVADIEHALDNIKGSMEVL